jgi:hypothetical protein
MKICLQLPSSKGVIFPLINRSFCIELLQVELPRLPPEDPLGHLQSLATILQLTSSLPEQLPMRNELHGLASRALDAAVADLGVQLQKEDVDKPTYAK